LARGLSNYSSGDAIRIMGLHTRDIERELGRKDFDEVIHRDNMWVISSRNGHEAEGDALAEDAPLPATPAAS
jgi:hypothetical protein